MTCDILEKLSDKEIFHERKMTAEFESMPESLIEKMTPQEEEQYVLNPKKEEEFEIEIRTEKGNHFKICEDENCQRLKTVWSEHPKLKEFVK